jgi:hypothetical protein
MAGTLRGTTPMNDPLVFLLSPAHCGGKRAAIILRAEAQFDLAQRLRAPAGAPLGEVFAFLSGLYFRGKLAYADRFARSPLGLPASLVITTNRGLVDPGTHIGPRDLASFGTVPIDLREPRYRQSLSGSVERLAATAPPETRFVLLGSIATAKYVELLVSFLGERVLFPAAFPGMGDMQRGALLLRAARSGEELAYVAAEGAVRSRASARGTDSLQSSGTPALRTRRRSA